MSFVTCDSVDLTYVSMDTLKSWLVQFSYFPPQKTHTEKDFEIKNKLKNMYIVFENTINPSPFYCK